jgi:hypothetical protein
MRQVFLYLVKTKAMKDVITLLIEDDIKITRLIRTLAKVGIDASAYTPNKTSVVLRLLELDYEIHSNEYLKLIEQTADSNNDLEIIDWLEKSRRQK